MFHSWTYRIYFYFQFVALLDKTSSINFIILHGKQNFLIFYVLNIELRGRLNSSI